MEPIHGERIVDGDASTLTALTLYKGGGVVERTLGSTEFLVITDVLIHTETGGDFNFVADSAAGGRYIAYGNLAANGGIERAYNTPYRCPRGVVPKFAGPASNRSICIIEGFISPT